MGSAAAWGAAFAGDKMTISTPGGAKGMPFTFKLDPAAQPKRIELKGPPGEGKDNMSLYKLDGDELTL